MTDFTGSARLRQWRADEYAYFRVEGTRATARELEELAADAGAADVPGAGEQIVARLDPTSSAREGQKLELWFDPRKVQLFNPDRGRTSRCRFRRSG